jgi:hypothetical protein
VGNEFTITYLILSANSGPVASIFWHNEEYATGLGKDIFLDGVVCVVDAVFGEKVQSSLV